MHSEPTAEQEFLKKFIGEWAFESEASMEPGGDVMQFNGTESVRPIGDNWVVGEMNGKMPDGHMAIMMNSIGFSTTRNRFVGTFFGSPDDHLWIYDGSLDNANNELTLEAEGPSMTVPGKFCSYRDINRFVSDNERQFRSEVREDDGTWRTFMRATYTKQA